MGTKSYLIMNNMLICAYNVNEETRVTSPSHLMDEIIEIQSVAWKIHDAREKGNLAIDTINRELWGHKCHTNDRDPGRKLRSIKHRREIVDHNLTNSLCK